MDALFALAEPAESIDHLGVVGLLAFDYFRSSGWCGY